MHGDRESTRLQVNLQVLESWNSTVRRLQVSVYYPITVDKSDSTRNLSHDTPNYTSYQSMLDTKLVRVHGTLTELFPKELTIKFQIEVTQLHVNVVEE